jgi:hypothetical protein
MQKAVSVASRLITRAGSLVLMTTGSEADSLKAEAGSGFAWNPAIKLPFSTDRVIEVGVRMTTP